MPKHFSIKTSTVNCTFEPTECESVNKEHKKMSVFGEKS